MWPQALRIYLSLTTTYSSHALTKPRKLMFVADALRRQYLDKTNWYLNLMLIALHSTHTNLCHHFHINFRIAFLLTRYHTWMDYCSKEAISFRNQYNRKCGHSSWITDRKFELKNLSTWIYVLAQHGSETQRKKYMSYLCRYSELKSKRTSDKFWVSGPSMVKDCIWHICLPA